MNKLLLLTAGLLMGIGQVQAQCTPDTTITDLLVPPAGSRYDTVGGEPIVILPYAQAYQSYSEVLQFKVPKDTMVFNLQGVVDSVRLLKVINLPPTLTMNCNPTGCKFIGGDYGCAEMSGIPQVPDSVEIRVAIEYWIRVGTASSPIKDTLGGFYLVTRGNVDLPENKLSKAPVVAYPNPAQSHITLRLSEAYQGDSELQVSNLLGSTVMQKKLKNKGAEKLELEVGQLKPGVYLYRLQLADQSFTGKFSIAR